MFAIIHLGTSHRVAESENEAWLKTILTDYKVCRRLDTGNWRIVHPRYNDLHGYRVCDPCEFEILPIKVPTGGFLGNKIWMQHENYT